MSKKQTQEKETIIKRFGILVGDAIQVQPTTPQEAMLAAKGALPKKNGWVGNNYENADAFILIVQELDKAKLFLTLEEAEAYATFLAHTANDTRLQDHDINVFEISTTINNTPVKAFRNKYLKDNASKADKKAEALKEEMKKDAKAIKGAN